MRKKRSEEILLDAAKNKKKFMYKLKKKPKKHNRNKLGELLGKKRGQEKGGMWALLYVSRKSLGGGGMDSK